MFVRLEVVGLVFWLAFCVNADLDQPCMPLRLLFYH